MQTKAERLYLSSPVWLQNVLVTAKGWELHRERFGRTNDNVLTEATERLFWSGQQVVDYVDRQVLGLLHDVRSHPYFGPLIGSSLGAGSGLEILRDIPILDKGLVRQDSRFSEWSEKFPIAGYASTTGTTGSPLRVPYTREARQRNFAFYERVLNIVGLSQLERHARLGGRILMRPDSLRPPFHRISLAQRALFLSSYHISRDSAKHYLTPLKKWKPGWVEGYPSSLYLLAAWLGRELRQIGTVRAVISTSATLGVDERGVIEDAWGAPVYDYYAAAEMCATIAQCRQKSYHLHTDFAWVELVKAPSVAEDEREIVCTSWGNPAFPLVRYGIGDVAQVAEQDCTCGLPFPVIGGVRGRRDDLVITPSGKIIGRLSPVAKGFPVVCVQYYQPDLHSLVVRVLPKPEWNRSWAARLQREVQLRVGSELAVRLDLERQPETGPGGKFRNVISEVKLADMLGHHGS